MNNFLGTFDVFGSPLCKCLTCAAFRQSPKKTIFGTYESEHVLGTCLAFAQVLEQQAGDVMCVPKARRTGASSSFLIRSSYGMCTVFMDGRVAGLQKLYLQAEVTAFGVIVLLVHRGAPFTGESTAENSAVWTGARQKIESPSIDCK